jgi:hypothetical protein
VAFFEELDGTWVAVVIHESPSSLNSLHPLVSLAIQVNFL